MKGSEQRKRNVQTWKGKAKWERKRARENEKD